MTALESPDQHAPIGSRLAIDAIDHIVLTVRDVDATRRFYVEMLGMREETFGDGRVALHFGTQKINLHVVGAERNPHAAAATPGSTDLCLLTRSPIEGVLHELKAHDLPVEQGPVKRAGASGELLSVYVRDPDGNLIEIANQLES